MADHSAPNLMSDDEVRAIVDRAFTERDVTGKRVLLVVPDSTRTAPVGLMFRTIHDRIAADARAVDVMIALGTHPPMSDEAILRRLEMSPDERTGKYRDVRLMNHAWDDPNALAPIGRLTADDVRELSEGLFAMEVDVTINRAALEYDQIVIVGPVFPHEVVGFSGGSKYLFPGIGGAELLNFFHWLGAVVTSPRIIGHANTPVRAVIERAAAMVPTPKMAFCMVVEYGGLAGLFAGDVQTAWRDAARMSEGLHIVIKPRPFKTVLSCAPKMYDDMWVGGKCVYKTEPVVADGGEIIVYAPHIRDVSPVHGDTIRRIGYHVRDYFLGQWDRFKDEPWGELAHSTHVRGVGTYESGVERPRIAVTLATGIPEEECRRINLGYRDPNSIDVESYANREDEGVLLVRSAGEILYRLENPPAWARP